MGNFYDYFSAPTPEVAAAVIDWESGPGSPPENIAPLPYVDAESVDPAVLIGRLEALLTDRTLEEVAERPSRQPIAIKDGGMQLVLAVHDQLTEALATTDPANDDAIASEWATAEEFWGYGDPAYLSDRISQLRDLAIGAREAGHQLYCWTCL